MSFQPELVTMRINAAIAAESQILDLSGVVVSKIPDLSGMVLKEFRIPLFNGTEVDQIERLETLQTLEFGYIEPKRNFDISWISKLTNLRTLVLTGLNCSNFDFLTSLKHLKNLSLHYCSGITCLEFLAGLNQVIKLSFRDCENIKCFDPINEIVELKDLEFNPGNSSNLSWIRRNRELESLTLRGYPFYSLEPIGELKLQNLTISTPTYSKVKGPNKLMRLDPLPVCFPELITLEVSSSDNLTDIHPLVGLSRLVNLKLCLCDGITNLDAVSHLKQLRSLNIGGSDHINSLLPITSLREIVDLACWGITDPTQESYMIDIVKLPKLERLWIDYFLDAPKSVLSSIDSTDFKAGNCLPQLKEWLKISGRI